VANNAVGWFEIYVQDIGRARAFYEEVLRVRLDKLPGPDLEMWAFPMDMAAAGASGAIVHMPGFPSGGNSTLIYFTCNDCAEEAGRVIAAGGRIEKDKFSIGDYGFIALVYDPDGNMIGLHSMA
jgi:predicted enzyme related to lactoylglutathione lyase